MSNNKADLSDDHLKKLILDVEDFPIPGVMYKDITPVLLDHNAFTYTLKRMTEPFDSSEVDLVLAIESRGLIFGSSIANSIGRGLALVRKEDKLPREKIKVEHYLEYGEGVLEIHKDAIKPGQRVLIVDDVLATGGTSKAAAFLVEELEGKVAGLTFLVELPKFKGRDILKKYKVHSVVSY